jgi:hypothetical protein
METANAKISRRKSRWICGLFVAVVGQWLVVVVEKFLKK